MSTLTALAVVDVTKMTTQIVTARVSITALDPEKDTRAETNSQIETLEARIMALDRTALAKHIIGVATLETGTMTFAAVANHTVATNETSTIASRSISIERIMAMVGTQALTTAPTTTLLISQVLNFLVFNRRCSYLLLKGKR